MPNEWMDEINKILDDYYNAKIDKDKTISRITSLNADYQDQFKMYDESITAQMEEEQSKESINE